MYFIVSIQCDFMSWFTPFLTQYSSQMYTNIYNLGINMKTFFLNNLMFKFYILIYSYNIISILSLKLW